MKISIDGRCYEFERITNIEGMALEKATGMTFGEWGQALESGSMLATTALVWLVMRREQPDLRFGDVEFDPAELNIEQDDPKDEETSPPEG
jgi:hypothetical protein